MKDSTKICPKCGAATSKLYAYMLQGLDGKFTQKEQCGECSEQKTIHVDRGLDPKNYRPKFLSSML